MEQNWSLLQTCIVLLQYIGDFTGHLHEAEKRINEMVLTKEKQLADDNDNDGGGFIGYRMTNQRDRKEFQKLVATVTAGQTNHLDGIFKTVHATIKPICEYIHDTTLATVFAPIEKHLQTIQPHGSTEQPLGGNADLPDYSFAPQEFITQVGQYLLTLPQHLEPLLLSPADNLLLALALCDDRYGAVAGQPGADVLLSLLVDETCAAYEQQIAHICELSGAGAKQVATDIDYLGSVLEELGLQLDTHLQQTAALLRAPADQYLTLSAGCDPKLVTAIRQMRNIVSKE